MKMPCLHRPQQPTLSQLGRDPPRAALSKGTRLTSRSCILQRRTLLGEQSTAPMRLCSGKHRLPISHIALCTTRAKNFLGCLWLRGHCCLAGGVRSWKRSAKVFSLAVNADLAWKGLVSLALANPHSQLGRDPPRAYLCYGTERASKGCVLQRETVLGEQTSAPMLRGSGSQRLPGSHLALGSP